MAWLLSTALLFYCSTALSSMAAGSDRACECVVLVEDQIDNLHRGDVVDDERECCGADILRAVEVAQVELRCAVGGGVHRKPRMTGNLHAVAENACGDPVVRVEVQQVERIGMPLPADADVARGKERVDSLGRAVAGVEVG